MAPEDELEIRRTIGANLRMAREARGYTQTEFAEHFGITSSAVCAVENGRALPSIIRLAEFADLLEVETEELLRGI